MEQFEKVETTSWLDFLTKGEAEDVDESEQRYLFRFAHGTSKRTEILKCFQSSYVSYYTLTHRLYPKPYSSLYPKPYLSL